MKRVVVKRQSGWDSESDTQSAGDNAIRTPVLLDSHPATQPEKKILTQYAVFITFEMVVKRDDEGICCSSGHKDEKNECMSGKESEREKAANSVTRAEF